MKKFSILLPCYNGEEYLEQAIKSVLNQDYQNWELIIIDCKSTDNSHKIIDKYCKLDIRIRWLRHRDKGLSDALNYALGFIQGDIFGFIGFDDYYTPGIFKKIINFLDGEDFFCVYGNSYNIYPDKNLKILVEPGRFSYNMLFLGNVLGLQNAFLDRDTLSLYRFDENNKYSMDYELWIRLFKKYKPLYIREVISHNIQRRNNISSKSTKEDLPGMIEVENVAKKNAKTFFQKLLVSSFRCPILRRMLFRFYKLKSKLVTFFL